MISDKQTKKSITSDRKSEHFKKEKKIKENAKAISELRTLKEI